MKNAPLYAGAAALALSVCVPALANGQGSPVEPQPGQEPVALEPAGPAPAASVQTASEGTNWWLIGLGVATVVGVVVLMADGDDDDTND